MHLDHRANLTRDTWIDESDFPDPPENPDFLSLPASLQAEVARRFDVGTQREARRIDARQDVRAGLADRRDRADRVLRGGFVCNLATGEVRRGR